MMIGFRKKAGLQRTSKWLMVITFVLSCVRSHAEMITGYSVKGTLRYVPDPNTTNRNHQRTPIFIRNFEWFESDKGFCGKLRGVLPLSEKGMSFYLASDGIDVFSAQTPPLGVPKKPGITWPAAYATLRRQVRPETDETFGSFLWLAFSSREYFANSTNQAVHPPKAGLENHAHELVKGEWEMRSDAVSPNKIRYLDSSMLQTEPPIELLVGTFDWLTSTNVDGREFPGLAVYEEFVEWRDARSGPILRVEVLVEEITRATRPLPLRPELNAGISVTDHRFVVSNLPVHTVSYFLKDNTFRPLEHPYLQQLYADSLRPQRAAARNPPIFWLTSALVAGFLIWKTLLNRPKER